MVLLESVVRFGVIRPSISIPPANNSPVKAPVIISRLVWQPAQFDTARARYLPYSAEESFLTDTGTSPSGPTGLIRNALITLPRVLNS